MNKHNQKPTDMFNKQDVTVYLTCIKIFKDLNILNFRLHIPEATISYIFHEHFIEIPQLFQEIRRFPSSILTIFNNFSDILTFPCDISLFPFTLNLF